MNQEYHLFSGKRDKIEQLFQKSFANESLSILQYRSQLNKYFAFNIKFALNPPNFFENESSIKDEGSKNLGSGSFITNYENILLKQKFDTNQTLENHFYYRFKNFDSLIFYSKIEAKTSNLTKNTLGISYKPLEYVIGRLQADLKTLSIQFALKGEYKEDQNEKKSGAAVSIIYKERLLKLEKFTAWHSFDGINLCGGIEKYGVIDFTLSKIFNPQKQLAYEIKFQPSGVQCQYEKIMRIAFFSQLNNQVSVVAKMDNDFKGQIGLIYQFDNKMQLVVINKVDLDIRTSKSKKIFFPVALKFLYEQQ